MYGQPYGYAAGYAPSVAMAMVPYASGAEVLDYSRGARGGPLVEFRQWARSNPDFLAWAKAQGSGWTGLFESVGTPAPRQVEYPRPWISPQRWREMARAYSVQMNYMGQRWPTGMAYLNAALDEWAGMGTPPHVSAYGTGQQGQWPADVSVYVNAIAHEISSVAAFLPGMRQLAANPNASQRMDGLADMAAQLAATGELGQVIARMMYRQWPVLHQARASGY